MNIEHISISRTQVWDECKQKYKYRYHLNLKSPEPEPFYFTYGKVIHKIAEEYVEQGGKTTLAEITHNVLKGEIPITRDSENNPIFAPTIPPEYKSRMPDHLKSIYQITEQMGVDGQLEFEFKYDLDPPNGRFVTGFIDRLIPVSNGNYYIIDYKTTKRGIYRKTRQTIKNDLQLRCYARVVQNTFNIPADKIFCALYYLEGGDLIPVKFPQSSLDTIENELLQVYMDIENTHENSVVGTIGNHCKRCDYRKPCPFFKGY